MKEWFACLVRRGLSLSKLRYCRLKKTDILILDENGSNYIREMILWDQEVTVLPCLQSICFLNVPILLNLLLNFTKILHVERGFFKVYWYAWYYISVIQWLNPRVIITYIDNGSDFQLASQFYRKSEWFFIQNGTRWPSLFTSPYLPNAPDKRSTIHIANWFCFGESEAVLLRQYGHIVENALPVGSLLGSWHMTHNRGRITGYLYDICLISQQAPHVMCDDTSMFRFAVIRLEDYLRKYIQERSASLAIAMRSGEAEEFDHYAMLYGSKATIIRNDRQTMSTFRTIDKSRVTLTVTSTAGYEAFGWGSKVMFCNFSGDPNYDTPIGGDWCLTENSYDLFSERLTMLLALPHEVYLQNTAEKRRFYMQCDPDKPAYLAIRETVLQSVEKDRGRL